MEDGHAQALRHAESRLKQRDNELDHYMLLYGGEEEEFSRQIVGVAEVLLAHKMSVSSQIEEYRLKIHDLSSKCEEQI